MKQYFIHDGQNQQGPFDLDQLKNIKLKQDNMVWCEGMETWKPAGEIEELKTLFAAVPPPLPKNLNTPPPLVPKKQAVPAAGKVKKKGLLWIIIGSGVGAILITAVVILLAVRSCNSVVERTSSNDSTAVQAESSGDGSPDEVNSGNKEGQKDAASRTSKKEENMSEAQKKEEEQKAAYRRNWSKYVYVRANYDTGPFGLIMNPTVTLTNNLPYTVNEVTVWLNYIMSTGGTWKSEKVIFYNVGPNSSSTKNAPPTDRGTSIQTRIYKVTSHSLGLYYSN